MELGSVETRMGKKTIELHHVSKSYGDKKILEDFSYIVLRNQRLGIIGPNGCGKSTLLKMIAGPGTAGFRRDRNRRNRKNRIFCAGRAAYG